MASTQANNELAQATQIAQFRFALIAPVIQELYPDASATEYYKRVTQNPLVLPDGKTVTYSYKTLEKWVSQYKREGFESLMPKVRSDKGTTRSLSSSAIEEIYRIKQSFPRLNATQIYNHLIENGFISPKVSVCAVQRFVKRNDLRGASNPQMKDRKQFEEAAFGRMWQADTCYLPHITEDGKTRRVYAIAIIDDCSRVLVGGELFYHDNAANFQKVLKEAISTYGIPHKLFVDNGCSYANEQLSLICGSLGIVLVHSRVRDGASKGKIERHWLTLKETWLYKLDVSSISSLLEFNSLLKDYMRSYNTTLHSSIGCTPLERYLTTKDSIKEPLSFEWLDECFLNRIIRKVKKDSTVSINKISYDTPMQFIGQKVEIRFCPNDMSSAFILYEKKHYPITKTNRVENCHTKRNNPEIDYRKM